MIFKVFILNDFKWFLKFANFFFYFPLDSDATLELRLAVTWRY